MAKSQKQQKKARSKSLNALRAQMGKDLAANTAKAEGFKVNVKHVHVLASKVIEAAKHAHEGIRLQIITWKGERPETLDALKEDIRKACKAWLKEEGKRISPQAIYNLQSELIGACNGYIAYAGMSDSKRKAFDKHHAERTSYHSLIKFLRDTKRGKRTTPDVNQHVARIKSGWKNRSKEMLKQAKDLLRYSPTDALLNLIDFAEALVKARKQGNVEKMQGRKAA